MAQSTLLILMALCLLSSSSSSQLSFAQMEANAISAAPALLPSSPSSSSSSPPLSSPSPALSPDITPLFPSPSGGELSPTESSLPTIPSSPSPPNPDDISSFGPNTMAISPSGSLPMSSSVSWNSATSMVMVVSLGAFLSFHI
ncbi:putative classical arabinogalactan protein [Helianthus annuus]|nr:putative classical arabinogalactan protein [Helianthus annuus]